MGGIVEVMNATSLLVKRVRRAHPEEKVLFASAATLVYDSKVKLVGISPRRVFQHRGVLLLTDRALRFRSGFLSPLTLLWTVVVGCLLWEYVRAHDVLDLVLAIILSLLILQRLPYRLDLPLTNLRVANRATVQGLVALGHGLVISDGHRYLHFITTSRVPISEEGTPDAQNGVSPSSP